MNFAIVTRDAGPSKALYFVADRLRKLGHNVEHFLGGGHPFPVEKSSRMHSAVVKADHLLSGISSSEERSSEEQQLCQLALRRGIRFSVFSDIYGAYNRPWFKHLIGRADTLFVTDEQEVEGAKKSLGSENRTKVVASGNPYWADFFEVTVNREEVRRKLGIKPEEKMIMVVGNKELERNVLLFTDLVMATRIIQDKYHLVLTMHPGARHQSEDYQGITRWSNHPVQFPAKDVGLSSQQMIAGADLVVTSGGSSVGIMAACQRVPVVDLFHPLDELYWEELSGLDFWPPVEARVSVGVETLRGLSNMVICLLDPRSREAEQMRGYQEKHFYLGKFEGATGRIVDALVA